MNELEATELLTKARLLEGAERRERAEIPSLGGAVEIRPLTAAQWADVQNVMMEGITLKVSRGPGGSEVTELDAARSKVNDYRSDLLICRLGLNEGWTDAELGRLPAGAIAEIASAVANLSGVSKNPRKNVVGEALQSFREEEPGTGDTAS